MKSVPLEEICLIEMGQAPKGSSYNTDGIGFPLLAGAGDFGTDHPKPSKFTTSPTKLSKPNDILLCIRATVGDLNWSDKEYCLGRGVAGLRPKNGALDRNYLWRWLETHRINLERKARGSTFKQVSRRDIAGLVIDLPKTVEDQRRIAAILDKANGIRRRREQVLKVITDFLKSEFIARFGTPLNNSKCLPAAPIKLLGRVVTGNTPPRKDAINYGDEIEWIKSDNINTPDHFLTHAEEYLSPTGRRLGRAVPAGSTLVTCIAGSPSVIGNAALADREVAFNQQINAVIPNDETDPFFLYCQILVAKPLIQSSSTNSMKGMVSKGKFQEIEFLKPSHSEQVEFGKFFTRAIAMSKCLEADWKESEQLFGSLAQRAFRGEL